MSRLIEAWSARTPRERIMLSGLGVVVAALALWYGAYAPLARMAETAQARQQVAAQTLAEVEAYATSLKPRTAAGDAATVSQAARALAGETGVPLLREEIEGGTLAVWTEPVAAKVLFAWLARLAADGIGVRQFEAHQGEAGLVDARVVLVGGGA